MERKIVPEHSGPVAILQKDTEANITIILLHEAPIDEQSEHSTIRAAQFFTIPAETESLVLVLTSKCGLMSIERMQMAKPTQWILTSCGVLEVCHNVQF